MQGNSLAGELHPLRRVVMVNWANAAFGLGAVMTPLLASVWPWQAVYLLIAGATLVTLLLTLDAPAAHPDPAPDLRPGLGVVAVLAVAIAFHSGLEGALATWSGSALASASSPGAHGGQAALLTLYWLGLTLGRLALAPWVARAPGPRVRLLALGIAGATALYFVRPLSPGWPLLGVLLGPVFGTLVALAQQRAGSALLAPIMYAAALGGTLLPGALAGVPVWSLPIGFALFAAVQWFAVQRVSRALG